MATTKTILSAGALIRALLLDCDAVTAITHNVFPVYKSQALLPYIVFRRSDTGFSPDKSRHSADTANYDVVCYAKSYEESLQLAEAAREALHCVTAEDDDLRIRQCSLTDASEGWENDAFAQYLTFTVKA